MARESDPAGACIGGDGGTASSQECREEGVQGEVDTHAMLQKPRHAFIQQPQQALVQQPHYITSDEQPQQIIIQQPQKSAAQQPQRLPAIEELFPQTPAKGGVIIIDGLQMDITEHDGLRVDMGADLGAYNDMAGDFRGNNDAVSGTGNVDRNNGEAALLQQQEAEPTNGTPANATTTNISSSNSSKGAPGFKTSKGALGFNASGAALHYSTSAGSLDYIANFTRALPAEVVKQGIVVIRNANVSVDRFRGLDLGLTANINVTNNMSNAFVDNNGAYSVLGNVLRNNGLYLPFGMSGPTQEAHSPAGEAYRGAYGPAQTGGPMAPPPPSPPTPASPSPPGEATSPAPAPAPAPTPEGGNSCCWNSCGSCSLPGAWCASSDNCLGACGGTWLTC